MSKLAKRSREWILIGIILLIVVVVSCISPQFLSMRNIQNILRANSINGIMALGMMFLIITGNIDVSVGASMMMCGGVFTTVVLQRMPDESFFGYIAVFGLAIIVGIVIGLISGSFTTFLKLPSIVVTLGMYSVLSGSISIATNGSWIINFPYWFTSMTAKKFLGVYVSIWIYAVIILLAYVLLNRLTLGRNILAYGGNHVSAKRAGLSEARITLIAFAIMGATIGVSSVLLVSSNALFDPTAGSGYELDVIAIVILGGAALSGGAATVAGTVLATILIGVMKNAIVMASVPIYYQKLVVGATILFSVVSSAISESRRRAPARKHKTIKGEAKA